jgi:hypothetical protein
MKKKDKIILIIFILITGIILSLISLKGIYLGYQSMQGNNVLKVDNIKEEETSEINNTEIKNDLFVEPIAEFEERITKKPFGIYITSNNSPVQPEKFQGYHTGSDVEYEDVDYEVEVFAIENGRVILSQWVSGYGGVVAISHNIENENVISLYGHLDPESLMSINSEANKGDVIGILGEGGTNETDYERKHLHLGIIKGSKINLRGYVNNEGELSEWYDPVEFLKKIK